MQISRALSRSSSTGHTLGDPPPLRVEATPQLWVTPERCGTMRIELSALFERECAPVAERIRAADFGLSRLMRCGPSMGGGA